MQLTELECFLSGPKRQRRGSLLKRKLIRLKHQCARKCDAPSSQSEYQQANTLYSAVSAALETLNYLLSETEIS
ncbi:EscE/YscE/SsaE family type III secretion system needle protein co-chaperone [Ewingella americana]|uniref:EscE/YscE/SsaE family type III secretion system needle protein co-chaperone n=1 Tax=Ewingella americana TaxID=41202 RepID=UPI0012AEA3C1|nr:EscE/YscE/SsaE family type III secretion system needle protein co-chaperone [Ewingella americana]MRT05901.1 hypothetical protein [Ewingella americana]